MLVILTTTCSGVHESKLTDLTLEMWTPRLRWIPAHRIHKKIPRFQDAHLGPNREIHRGRVEEANAAAYKVSRVLQTREDAEENIKSVEVPSTK
ncbi:hypothetical protein J6590_070018 [Homalodisca vitripennis]|nr:hypothetical protein J6590_070018 [Homalodisca vitripennis]